MRITSIAGVALIIVAAFIYIEGGLTSRSNVMDVGGMTMTMEEQHPVQPWIAGLMLLGGVALLITDTRRQRA
jgi:hypothetical protein